MAPSEQITFYTAESSPWGHRVHIALEEANVKYTTYHIDPRNKPEWYYEVNPLGKVPALTFGGPDVPPDQPSPESAKLAESAALLEFIADVFPEAHLLPDDPVLRAKARAFTEIFRNYVDSEFRSAFFMGKHFDGLLLALEKLQRALPPSGFAVGQWTIADAAVAPFLARMLLFVRVGLGTYGEEDWQKLREALASDRFARIVRYIQDVHERPSFKKTWVSDDRQLELWKNHPGLRRKAGPAS
ncbi:thioredoxin-like protein [Cubamyces menziesii]|nr:thioredoxin-like protein [Cubamyces menziesii]